jgi:hypothetical protein
MSGTRSPRRSRLIAASAGFSGAVLGQDICDLVAGVGAGGYSGGWRIKETVNSPPTRKPLQKFYDSLGPKSLFIRGV